MKELIEKKKVPVTFLHWGVETNTPRRIVGLTNTCAMDMILFIAYGLRIDSRQYGSKLFHRIRKLLDPENPAKLDADRARNILTRVSWKQEY
jgi:phage baseplate assembly protein W